MGGTGTDSEEVSEDRCASGRRRSWSTTGRSQRPRPWGVSGVVCGERSRATLGYATRRATQRAAANPENTRDAITRESAVSQTTWNWDVDLTSPTPLLKTDQKTTLLSKSL